MNLFKYLTISILLIAFLFNETKALAYQSILTDFSLPVENVSFKDTCKKSTVEGTRKQGCEPCMVDLGPEIKDVYYQEWIVTDENIDTIYHFKKQSPRDIPFAVSGIYFVEQKVWDVEEDLVGRIVKIDTIEIFPTPIPAFHYYPDTVALPNANVTFYNATADGDYYLWIFGDEATSDETDPVHLYQSSGAFFVTVVAINIHNCLASEQIGPVIVLPEYTLGIEKLKDNEIELFPNPTKEFLNIKIDGYNLIDRISILDLQGRVLLSKSINSKENTIDVSILKDGLYFIKAESGKKAIRSKFIKKSQK